MRKRFRFSLERVLAVRRLEERLRQAELASARAYFLAAERALERTKGAIAEGTRDLASLRKVSPLPLADCLRAEGAIEDLNAVARERESAVERKRQEMENAREQYFAAAARRKALDRLRETRKAQHQKEMASAESKLFDEIAGARAARRLETEEA